MNSQYVGFAIWLAGIVFIGLCAVGQRVIDWWKGD